MAWATSRVRGTGRCRPRAVPNHRTPHATFPAKLPASFPWKARAPSNTAAAAAAVALMRGTAGEPKAQRQSCSKGSRLAGEAPSNRLG